MTLFPQYSSAPHLLVANDPAAPEEASSGTSDQSWMRPAPSADAMIDANQLASLNAMISYLAAMSGQSEYRIERSLADRFSIPNVKCMLTAQFDKAIHYLVDTLKA